MPSAAATVEEQILFTIITLAVALIGGVPGVLAIINHLRARPKLVAYVRQIALTQTDLPTNERVPAILLHLTIGNRGEEPLLPLEFKLKCEVNDKWYTFSGLTIPEGFTIPLPDGSEIVVDDVERKDLRNVAKIVKNDPRTGYLAFWSRDLSIKELEPNVIRMNKMLDCKDLSRKIYSVQLNDDLLPHHQKKTPSPSVPKPS